MVRNIGWHWPKQDAMTPPRFIVPGATYLVTRRCIGRRYLLRPDKEMMDALLYCLAVAAKRYNVSAHALCVMSSHYHLIATDTDGNFPLFTQYFHRLVALSVQKLRGWDEVVWEPGRKTSMVELLDDGAAIAKTLYTLCNPTFCPRTKRLKGEVSPRFASRCKKTLLGAIKRMHAFYDAYRTAIAEYAQGIATDFPEGTWKMKRLLGHT